jgi:hypothetical protein
VFAACGFARQNAKPQAAFLLGGNDSTGHSMSDAVVTLARFHDPMEAQLAKDFLEANGIAVELGGENAANLQLNALDATVTLYVREYDAERAAELLTNEFGKLELDDDWRDRVEDDSNYWLCPLCGAAVGDDLQVCDACDTQREHVQSKEGLTRGRWRLRRKSGGPSDGQGITAPGGTTPEPSPPVEPAAVGAESDDLGDIIGKEIRLYSGDKLASRALTLALLGFICFFTTMLAFYFVIKITTEDIELSERGRMKCYLALAIIVVQLVVLALLFKSGSGPP